MFDQGTYDLQVLLASKGFDPGPLDGIYGPQTQAAHEALTAAVNFVQWQQTAAQPGATEIANWTNQRRQIQDTYDANKAGIEFQRGNLKQQEAVDTERMGQNFGQQKDSKMNEFIRRGLFQSGLYQEGQQDLTTQQNREKYDVATQYQQKYGQLNLDLTNATTAYSGGRASVDAMEAARRAEVAAQIRSMF